MYTVYLFDRGKANLFSCTGYMVFLLISIESIPTPREYCSNRRADAQNGSGILSSLKVENGHGCFGDL